MYRVQPFLERTQSKERLLKDQGGHAIAVYNPGKRGARDAAAKLVNDGRATLFASATYESGSQVEQAVQAIIDRIEATSRIGLSATAGRRRNQHQGQVIEPPIGLS